MTPPASLETNVVTVVLPKIETVEVESATVENSGKILIAFSRQIFKDDFF